MHSCARFLLVLLFVASVADLARADHGTLGSRAPRSSRRPPDAAVTPFGGYETWPRTPEDVRRGQPVPGDADLDRLRFDCIVQRVRARHIATEVRRGGDVKRCDAFLERGNGWIQRGDWARERSRTVSTQAVSFAREAWHAYQAAREAYVRARRDRDDWPAPDSVLVEPGSGLSSPWDGTPPRARRTLQSEL